MDCRLFDPLAQRAQHFVAASQNRKPVRLGHVVLEHTADHRPISRHRLYQINRLRGLAGELSAAARTDQFETGHCFGGRRVYCDAAHRQRIGRCDRRVIREVLDRIKARPDQTVGAPNWIRAITDGSCRRICRVSGNVSARGGTVRVTPAMILALELCSLVDTDRQPHAAMQATVLPDVDGVVVGAPHGQFLTEQDRVENVPERQIGLGSDRIPGSSQNTSLCRCRMVP